MASSIGRVGIVCGSCRWRNNGDSNHCVNCNTSLIQHRPLDKANATRWVEAQMKERKRLGVETSVVDLKVLRGWATGLEALDETASEASASVSQENVFGVAVVCVDCGKEFAEHVKFCSDCGGATRSPEAPEIVEQLEKTVRHLLSRVEELERTRESVGSGGGQRFDWISISNEEKWRVTWGVFGRTILINVGLWTGLILLLFAIGVIGAASSL